MFQVRLCVCVLVAIGGSVSGRTAWAAEANINKALAAKFLVADSFEEGDRAPREWHQGADLAGVTYDWDKGVASHGERSLSLRKRANRYFPVAEWSRVVAHATDADAIEVRVKVKAVRATKAIVDVAFLDEQDQLLSHEWAAYIGVKEDGDKPATHDWQQYKGTVAIPEGTARLAIGLQIYGPGSLWFDELLVRYVKGGAPLEPVAESQADDTAPVPTTLTVGQGEGEYLFLPATEKSDRPSALLIVLPGGDGSADFHPFVRTIQRESLPGDMAVLQLIAPKFTAEQRVVWPTQSSSVADAKFTTEQLVAKAVEDVVQKVEIDRQRVYMLGWSSGGPACYSTMLQENSPVAGALIAMSVFKPDVLPELEKGNGRAFYILHSADDQVCPFAMAEAARDQLRAAGAKVEFAEYEGGHGWQGDVFGNIRRGIEWLNQSSQD